MVGAVVGSVTVVAWWREIIGWNIMAALAGPGGVAWYLLLRPGHPRFLRRMGWSIVGANVAALLFLVMG